MNLPLEKIRRLEWVKLTDHEYRRQPATGRYFRLACKGRDSSGEEAWEYPRLVFANKTEARRFVTRLQAELLNGESPVAVEGTLGEWLGSWLAGGCGRVSPRTLQGYKGMIERRIEPALGHVRLADLEAQTLNRFYQSLRDEGLGERTVLHHHRCLHRGLGAAVKAGRLTSNPVTEAVDRPRPEDTSEKVRWLRDTELARLLEQIEGERLVELPVLLGVLVGLRAGEVCALRWRNVDLDARIIRVEASVEYTKANGLREKAPKSRNSRRPVPLSRPAAARLAEIREELAEDSLDLVRPDAYLVCELDGSLLSPSKLSSRWRRWADRNGFEGVRFHDLRHTAASFWLNSGVPLFTVSRWLGHSTVQITGDLYGHLEPRGADADPVSDRLEALQGSVGSVVDLGELREAI